MTDHPDRPEDADDLDDDEPLDADEAAAGTALAGEPGGESLEERVAAVLADLEDVTSRRDGPVTVFATGGRVFAALGHDLLEVALDAPVARAALNTPDTCPSPRGAGWVAFTPAVADRFALDRAAAWVRSAHRRASDGRR